MDTKKGKMGKIRMRNGKIMDQKGQIRQYVETEGLDGARKC